MIRTTLVSAMAAIFGTGVVAQVVEECDWRASLQAVVEPLDANTATFANGAVRLTVTDSIEPAAGSYYVVVISPPYNESGGAQCQVVTRDANTGFSGVDFSGLVADYDPARGLVWRVPVEVYDAAQDRYGPHELEFTLNQATGAMTADLAG